MAGYFGKIEGDSQYQGGPTDPRVSLIEVTPSNVSTRACESRHKLTSHRSATGRQPRARLSVPPLRPFLPSLAPAARPANCISSLRRRWARQFIVNLAAY